MSKQGTTPSYLVNLGLASNLSHHDLYKLSEKLRKYQDTYDSKNQNIKDLPTKMIRDSVVGGLFGAPLSIGIALKNFVQAIVETETKIEELNDIIISTEKYFKDKYTQQQYLGEIVTKYMGSGHGAPRKYRVVEGGSKDKRDKIRYEISKAL